MKTKRIKGFSYVDNSATKKQIKYAEYLAKSAGHASLAIFLEKMEWKKQRFLTKFNCMNVIGYLKEKAKKPTCFQRSNDFKSASPLFKEKKPSPKQEKDESERKQLKKQYISEWLKYKAEHPDMPLRENFGSGKAGGRVYRETKDKWNESVSDMSDYCVRRYNTLVELGHEDLTTLYSNYLSNKGKLHLIAVAEFDAEFAAIATNGFQWVEKESNKLDDFIALK